MTEKAKFNFENVTIMLSVLHHCILVHFTPETEHLPETINHCRSLNKKAPAKHLLFTATQALETKPLKHH